MPRSRSFTRLTMRVGLLHFGQSVDFVVSIIFLRSPVFAILAIGRVFLLLWLSLRTRAKLWHAASTARSWANLCSQRDCQPNCAMDLPEGSRTRSLKFTSTPQSSFQS